MPPSLKVPIAVNCWLVFCAMVGLPGKIVIDDRSAAFMVREVLPLTEADAAAMVRVPRFPPTARPLVVIEATRLSDDVQVTVSLMSCVVPSEKVPMAVNCWRTPKGIEAFAGVTTIEFSTALVTMRLAVPKIVSLAAAVIVTLPGAKPLTRPCVSIELLILTRLLADELHVTAFVMFCVLPSVKVPVAVN